MNDLLIDNIRLRINPDNPKGYDVILPSGVNGQKFEDWKFEHQLEIKAWIKMNAIHAQIKSKAIKKKSSIKYRKRTKNA